MLNDFKKWHDIKSDLSNKKSRVVFKESDIWWCSLGVNLGEEAYGKGSFFRRPVLVFRKLSSNSFLGLPLTSKVKNGSWYVPIIVHQKNNWVMLNQARIIGKKRLSNKIVTLSSDDFEVIRLKFIEFYAS